MIKKIILNSFILFFSTLTVQAQDIEKAITSIPFKLINDKHIIIQGVINQKDTLNFYFDTGATSTLLDVNSAKKMGLKPNHHQTVEGAGGKKTYQIILNQTIDFNTIKLDSINLVLEDLNRLKKSLGHSFDGIIGYSMIKNYLTEVNFDTQQIYLYPKNESLDYSPYTQHSFTFDKGIPIPQLNTTIQLKNNEIFTDKVFFDSGAGLNLLMNTPYKEKNEILKKVKHKLTSETNNLSTKSISESIAIKKLQFAGYAFKDLTIDLASDKAGVSAYNGYLGILGAGIINRFNFILDYNKKKLYLKPNELFHKKFEITNTGFKLTKNELGEIYVKQVAKESPAYKKGMREGDVILSIDNKKFNSVEAYNEIFKQEGRKIKIILKKGQCKKKIKIKLKKLL